MEPTQPLYSDAGPPPPHTAEPAHIGIVADTANAMIEGPFESHLLRAIRAEASPARALRVSAAPLMNPLHTPQGGRELREQLNRDFLLVVAMLGIPDASDYEQVIHQLLGAWSDAKKPVLLIAGDNPGATRAALDSWQGWELLAMRLQHPAETVRQAVIVNEEHLIAQSGEKALAQIRHGVRLAESLQPVLLQKRQRPLLTP